VYPWLLFWEQKGTKQNGKKEKKDKWCLAGQAKVLSSLPTPHQCMQRFSGLGHHCLQADSKSGERNKRWWRPGVHPAPRLITEHTACTLLAQALGML